MANVQIERFFDTVAMQAYGCPRPVLMDAARRAMRRLCDESGVWVIEDADSVGSDGRLEFGFAVGPAEVVQIEAIAVDGRPLEPVAGMWLDTRFPAWRLGGTYDGAPRYYASIDDDTIQLVPWQNCTVHYRLRAIPSLTATEVPDFLLRKYRETVQAGMLAEVFNQRGQEWFMPELAMQHEARFREGIAKAQLIKAKGRQDAPLRTKASFF